MEDTQSIIDLGYMVNRNQKDLVINAIYENYRMMTKVERGLLKVEMDNPIRKDILEVIQEAESWES